MTELAENGSLYDILYKTKSTTKIDLTIQIKLRILREIVEAMNWLHNLTNPVLHLDLKPGNILVNNNHSNL